MLLAECGTELALAETLTSPSRKNIKHPSGKSMVISKLMRTHTDSAGIIDEDPGKAQPPDMQRFTLTEDSQRDHIKTLRHSQRNNRLIVLCPRCEEWITEAAHQSGLNLNSYNLPNNPDELAEIVLFKMNRFRQLIEDLVQRRNSRIMALRTYLTST